MPRVLAALFFLFTTLSVLAEEFPLDKRTRTEPVRSERMGQVVAASANGALVAWVDSRPHVEFDWVSGTRVRAMRFDARGGRIDERDFAIGLGTNVHVASDGRDYLVAYDDPAAGVRLVLVPGSGGSPVPLDADLETGHHDLFYAAGHYFVFHGDVTILDRGGNVRGRIAMVEPSSMQVVDAADGRILFVWNRSWELKSAVATIDELLDPGFTGFAAPNDLRGGDVEGLVRGPRGFALLTTDRIDYSPSVLLTLLDEDGRISGPPQMVYASYPYWTDTKLTLVRLGAGFAVVTDHHWGPGPVETRQRRDGAAILRLDAEGKALDAQPTRLTDREGDVGAVAGRDGMVWIAYEDGEATRVQQVDAAGRFLLPRPQIASKSRASQLDAFIERCATFDLVVWQEVSGDRAITKVRRFSHDGEPLGPAFRVTSDSNEYEASVLCGGTSALAWWSTSEGRRAALIGASGNPVPVALGSSASPAVFDGEHYVGTSFEQNARPDGRTDLSVRFQRWTERGEVLGESSPKITLPVGTLHSADLGWNGRHYLLAWSIAQWPDERPTGPLYSMRLTRDFIPLGPPIQIDTRPLYFAGLKGLEVGASPTQWLVGWVSGYLNIGWSHPMPEDWLLTTARIAANGSLLDPDQSAVSLFNAYDGLRQVMWNGSRWELITAEAITTQAAGGTLEHYNVLDEQAMLAAVSPAGARRLLIYTRIDPVDGVAELYGTVKETTEWQPASQPRRRGLRP